MAYSFVCGPDVDEQVKYLSIITFANTVTGKPYTRKLVNETCRTLNDILAVYKLQKTTYGLSKFPNSLKKGLRDVLLRINPSDMLSVDVDVLRSVMLCVHPKPDNENAATYYRYIMRGSK